MNGPPISTDNPTGQDRQPAANGTSEPLGDGHIVGNLTRDPDLKFTGSGRAVVKVTVAYTPRIRAANGIDWVDGETEFYGVNAWGRMAENVAEYLRQGDRVLAAGTWHKRTYEANDGQMRTVVELTARDLGPSMLFRGARVVRPRPTQDSGPRG